VAWDWWRDWRRGAGPDTTRERSAVPIPAPAVLPGSAHDGVEVELIPMVTTDLYRVSKAGAVNVVDLTLPHTLDIHEFDRLNESILALVRGEPEGQWVLDLARLSYMGSAALGLMVNLRQQIKQSGGTLVLCGLSPQLLQIFKTCCMERLFKIVKSRADAIAEAA